jgi:putative spermidine/putrescine transport system permease protein
MRLRLTNVVAIATLAFLMLPFFVVIGASFDSSSQFGIQFPPKTLSYILYTQIPRKYLELARNSLAVAATVAILASLIGTMAAFAIVRGRLVNREFLQSFFRLPVQIPLIVTGAVFLQFFTMIGSLTGFYATAGLSGLIAAHLIVALPYATGSISAVLNRVDRTYEEAAESLGATHWRVFSRITFPMIRPGVAVGAFYAFAVSFGDIPVSIFLVNEKTRVLPVEIFLDMQVDFQPSILALSTIVIVMSLLLMIFVQKVVGLDLVLSSQRKS